MMEWRDSIVALSVAIAIGMHYTAMAAATFVPSNATVDLAYATDISSLGLTGIVLVTFAVLAFAKEQ